MIGKPRKNLYFIDHYIRCGAMPLYLLFFYTKRGDRQHYAMLCSMKKLRLLLRQRKGFTDPSAYGHVIYKSYESEPDEILKYMLKSRYDFDLEATLTS